MRKATIFIVLSLLLVFCATPALANGIPALPHAFYGSVNINGSPAPDGSRVSATADQGDIIATQNPVTTSGGNYGITSPRLLVQGDISNGATITFYVNDVSTGQTTIFEAGGGPTLVDLGVTIPRPPPSGGGGGGGADKTPPRISNILLCQEGVTKTTADICWETHEKSDSQVEYWSNGHKFSPLDTEELIIEHHVHLTGLTPATTYHYKTMSRDNAGNLAVSEEQTFTTLGLPATFATSNLTVTPGEVTVGEPVTIQVNLTNRGDCEGCCETVLKINNQVEETEEVTLKAGATGQCVFTTIKDMAGQYSVDVNGVTGSFTVMEKPAPPGPPPAPSAPPAPKPINWTVLGAIIAGVVVAGLLIFLIVKRRAY
ncbi:fibronectin type III domain-containing protein [Chloroflexota bacterium]